MPPDSWIHLPPPAVQLAWLTAQRIRLLAYLAAPPHRLPPAVRADIRQTLTWLQERDVVVRGLLAGRDAVPVDVAGATAWRGWDRLDGESDF